MVRAEVAQLVNAPFDVLCIDGASGAESIIAVERNESASAVDLGERPALARASDRANVE